jgi:hypothetical protein
MPTEIYRTELVHTIEGVELEIIPLKIKYLKMLMNTFALTQYASNEEETLDILSECVRIAMKQYRPSISRSIEDIQENFDLETIYKVLEFSAGIKIRQEDGDVLEQANQRQEESEQTWESLDLAKLETEVFLLGAWKSYEELELSISIQELMAILSTNRELDYEEKRFMAALQGVDLDEQTGKTRGQQEWEDLKARVASGGKASGGSDILAYQGQNARKAGFGIGMGLDYEVVEG